MQDSENLGKTIDCADLVLETMVEFAEYYGLRVQGNVPDYLLSLF